MSDEGPDAPGRVARLRSRAEDAAKAAGEWLEHRTHTNAPIGIAVGLYERDRDAFGSVLGSAIALRLFLFLTSLIVMLVAGLSLFLDSGSLHDLITGTGVSGTVAAQVEALTANLIAINKRYKVHAGVRVTDL